MSAQSSVFNPSQTTSAASGDGFSCPRLTTTGRLAISFTTKDAGMMVYDTTLNNLFIWTGSAWESVPASGDAGANGSVQYNDNGVVSGAANLQYDKAGGFTSLRSGSALRAYVADNSVYSTISDLGVAGGLTIDNLNADGISLKIGGVNAYTLSAGVATWYDGAGGTRMTLNSTGLGVGVSPTSKLTIKPSASSSGIFEVLTGSTNTDSIRVSGGGTVNSWLELRGYLGVKLYSDATNTVTVDSAGNCGIGVAPSAWQSGYTVIDLKGGPSFFTNSLIASPTIGANFFIDSSAQTIYKANGFASSYSQYNSVHTWYTAPSGTAGNVVTLNPAMTLDASGNLLVGTVTSPTGTKIGSIAKLGGVSVEGTNSISVSTTPVALARTIGTGALFFVGGYNTTGGAQGWWLVASTGAGTPTVIASGNNTGLTVAFTNPAGILLMNTTSGTVSVTSFAVTN